MRFSDVLTYVLSVALALGVAAFAAYKVDRLSRMENPPANMGLNFPPPKRKVLMEETGEADPLITRSLGGASWPRSKARGHAAPQGPFRIASSYRLLTVVDGVAFVAVETSAGKDVVPVTVGGRLPGGFRVDDIQWRSGRWVLTAGSLVVEARPAKVQ